MYSMSQKRRLAVQESGIRKKIVEGAKRAGATLANGGKGGLEPDLALRVFQRDKFTCQVPGCSTPQEDLDLDHIGGHPLEIADDVEATKWLKEQAAKGKQDTEDGIHVLCLRHHNMVHDRERALEDGEKPKELPA
jgi:hypothetical protein